MHEQMGVKTAYGLPSPNIKQGNTTVSQPVASALEI
jgi:hypothetical protein